MPPPSVNVLPSAQRSIINHAPARSSNKNISTRRARPSRRSRDRDDDTVVSALTLDSCFRPIGGTPKMISSLATPRPSRRERMRRPTDVMIAPTLTSPKALKNPAVPPPSKQPISQDAEERKRLLAQKIKDLQAKVRLAKMIEEVYEQSIQEEEFNVDDRSFQQEQLSAQQLSTESALEKHFRKCNSENSDEAFNFDECFENDDTVKPAGSKEVEKLMPYYLREAMEHSDALEETKSAATRSTQMSSETKLDGGSRLDEFLSLVDESLGLLDPEERTSSEGLLSTTHSCRKQTHGSARAYQMREVPPKEETTSEAGKEETTSETGSFCSGDKSSVASFDPDFFQHQWCDDDLPYYDVQRSYDASDSNLSASKYSDDRSRSPLVCERSRSKSPNVKNALETAMKLADEFHQKTGGAALPATTSSEAVVTSSKAA